MIFTRRLHPSPAPTAPARRRLLSLRIAQAFAPAFAAVVLPAVAAGPAPNTLPTGGSVVAGQATISARGNAQLTVGQRSDKAIVQWQSFDIGRDAAVRFDVPSASSVTLNRVLGSGASAIDGRLSSNGRLILINPNGVVFGAGARVDAGGIVASTLSLSDDDFLAGRERFSRNGSSGAVRNQGEIVAGHVALLGTEVHNDGVIRADKGSVTLAAGETVTLGLAADGRMAVAVDQAGVDTLVANRQLIDAGGGQVLLSAQSAYELLGRVVNSGRIEAGGVDAGGGLVALRASSRIEHSGRIAADGTAAGAHGGNVTLIADLANPSSRSDVGGSISARGGAGGAGGFVETSATMLKVADGAAVDTRAEGGSVGRWLLDPYDFTIAASGGDITGSALNQALATSSVTIQTGTGSVACNGVGGCGTGNAAGHGDIVVNDALSWSSASTLTLEAHRNILINAPISVTGSGGLAFVYGQGAVAAGNTAAHVLTKPIDLAASASFSTRLGSDGATKNYTVLTSLGVEGGTWTGTTLQGVTPSGNYVLGADIDASATSGWTTGFTPLSGIYAGSFDGLGHTISGLNIRAGTSSYVGLFNEIGSNGSVRNLNLRNASVSNSGSGVTGILAGRNGGRIWGTSVGGSVSGGEVGGIVGRNGIGGVIENSFSLASVAGTGAVGGLVGANYGTLRDVYASGSVTGSGTPFGVGGLAGSLENYGGSLIENAYASGAVSGPGTAVGGLVGHNITANLVRNSFYDVQTTGVAAASNTGLYGTGLTTAQMQTGATYTGAGWNFNGIWHIGAGAPPTFTNMVVPLTVYLRLVANGFSSIYGSAPVYSWGFFDAASGGSSVSVATNGSAVWNGAPTATSNAGLYSIAYGGGLAASSYDIVAAPATNWTVQPKALTVSGLSAAGKVYDGSTAATLSGNAALQGVIGSDSVSLSAFTGGSFDTKHVGVAKTVSVNGLTLAGSGAANYTLTPTTLSATITPATLTLSGLSAANKVYDGNTTATLTGTAGLSGAVAGDSVSVSGTVVGSFNSRHVASANTVTVSGLSLGGSDGGNYTLAAASYGASITPKALDVVGLQVAAKAYDGGTQAVLTGTAALSGAISGDSVGLSGTAAGSFNSKDVAGAHSVSVSGLVLSGGDTGNYTLNATSLQAGITPLALTVTGLTVAGKTYDGSTAAALSGSALLGGVIAGDTVSLGGSAVASFGSKNAGEAVPVTVGGLTLAGSSAANYTLAQPTLSAAITPVALTLSGAGKVYDGSTGLATGAFNIGGLIGTEKLVLAGTATSADVAVTVAGVSSPANKLLSLTLADGSNGGLAANYTIAIPDALVVNITPKTLGVSGAAITRVYNGGKALTPTSITFTGLVGNQTLGYSNALASSADVGTGNYMAGLTLVNGTASTNGPGGTTTAGLATNYRLPTLSTSNVPVTITPKPITVTLSKEYDGNGSFTSTNTVTLGGVVEGDTVGVSGGVKVAPFYVDTYTAANFVAGSNTVALENTNYTIGTLSAVVKQRAAAATATLVFNDYLRNSVSAARYNAAKDAHREKFYSIFCPIRRCDAEVASILAPASNFLSIPRPSIENLTGIAGSYGGVPMRSMVQSLLDSAPPNSAEAWYYIDVLLGLGWKP